MAAAGAEVVVVIAVASAPPPKRVLCRGRPIAAAKKALAYLLLGGWWVASAGVITATVVRWAWGDDSAVVAAALMTSIGALLLVALILLILATLLLHALCAMVEEFRLVNLVKEFRVEVSGVPIREIPRDNVLLGSLMCIAFNLLYIAGAVVLHLPVEMSLRQRIGHALFDVGSLGITGICCFFLIPTHAMELWKTH